jgi:hypothetical protein
MALPKTRADHEPRPPTRAFVNPAEPAKRAVKGSNIAEPPRQLRTGGHHPWRTSHRTPDAHQAAAATGGGQAGALTPGPAAASDAMAAGMRSAFGRTATTVASDAANALLP